MHKTRRAASLTPGSLALAGAFPAFTLTGSNNGGDPASGGFELVAAGLAASFALARRRRDG